MDHTQFEQEKQYGAMLAIASRLHKRGLTTNEEHRKLVTELQKKYRPAASSFTGSQSRPKESKQTEVLGKGEL